MKALKNWVLTRGILYALSQAPIFAVLTGFFFKISPFYYTNFAVMISFLLMPAWISYRKKVSEDPDEPVHHLHRYALYALMPLAAFSLVRIPVMSFFNFPYWHPWFDFGHALTGEPMNEYASLIPGAMLYALQGYSLGLGFYILFSRYTLINSMLYLCVFLSSLYCYVFPEYGRVGMATPPLWHFVGWWAHFWMALTAWYVPIFFATVWCKSSVRTRAIALTVCVVSLISPYSFAFYKAYFWQFPRQHIIDQQIFNRANLFMLQSPPKLVALNKEAEYEFILRFGPRTYKNYINKVREIDAKDIRIDGEITYEDTLVAWCSTFLAEAETANLNDQFAPTYFAKLKNLDYLDIKVRCMGPKKLERQVLNPDALELKWHVAMTLVGDRESEPREFSGMTHEMKFAHLSQKN